MDLSVIQLVGGIFGLLLVAAATLALANRIRVIPFTVLLVVVGIGIVQLGGAWTTLGDFLGKFKVSDVIILYVFLPTLIYESSLHLKARDLKQNLAPILTLAVPGLLISTGLVGTILWKVAGLEAATAYLLGAVLSATDPVAVISIFKSLGAPKRLTVLVEGESLFNDATAVVLATILQKAALLSYLATFPEFAGSIPPLDVGHEVTHGAWHFVKEFFGGAALGAVAAFIIGSVVGRVQANPDIEISLTIILAYLAFLVAQQLHLSGVMAVVAAGVTMGSWGRTKVSPAVMGFMEHFWEFVAFLCNALIFLLVGLQVNLEALWNNIGLLGWTIVAMLVSRAVVVYTLTPVVPKVTNTAPISRGYQTIMYWGGLRGAIALAIILSIPELPEGAAAPLAESDYGFSPEYREKLIAVVTGAVLFTLLIPGLSIEMLVKKLGLAEPPLADRIAKLKGLISAKTRALSTIPQLQEGGLFSQRIAQMLGQRCESGIEEMHRELSALRDAELNRDEERKIMLLRCLGTEKTCYYEMFSKGHLSEQAYRGLAHSVELQADAVKHHGEVPDHTLYSPKPGFIQSLFRAFETEGRRTSRVALEYEETWGRHQGAQRVVDDLDSIGEAETARPEVMKGVRERYEKWERAAQERLDVTAEQFPEFVSDMQERLACRLMIEAEKAVIQAEARAGTLPGGVASSIVGGLETDLRALRGGSLGKLQVDPHELLRKVPFFQDTPANEFQRVADLLKTRTVPSGETIIRKGDKGDSLFLISRGVVRVSVKVDDEDRDLASLLAGDFFGEMAFLRGERRTADCRAVTPCAIHELRRADFDAVRQSCPAIEAALVDADRKRGTQTG